MNNYSDLIFLIAAIAIYGLLVNNTSRSLVLNNQILTDSEIEYGAISVAQDILEEARWMEYDEANVSNLQGFNTSSIYSVNINIPSGCPISGSSQPCKKINVEVESNFLTNEDGTFHTITMSLIKTKY